VAPEEHGEMFAVIQRGKTDILAVQEI